MLLADVQFSLPCHLPTCNFPTVPAGQTYNTSSTFELLGASQPDVVVLLGDLSYADLYYSNQTDSSWQFVPSTTPSTQQL